jgi:hypothetical protein
MSNDDPHGKERAGRVRDARGQTVRPLDPLALRLLGQHEGIRPDVLKEMCGRIGTRMTRIEIWLFGSPRVMHWTILLTAVCFGLLGIVGIGMAIIRPAGSNAVLSFLFPLSTCLALLGILWAIARRTRTRRVVEIMLEYLRCPQCGYDIRGLPVDPTGGATVCPECGSAWILREADTPQAMDDSGDGQQNTH